MVGDTIMTTDRAHAWSEGDGSEGWVVVVVVRGWVVSEDSDS